MIDTIEKYITEINNLYNDGDVSKHLFFRGHSNGSEYKLKPSVFRGGLLNEKEILLDFKQYAPFHEIKYDFIDERDRMLADMQHYGIPTRLIDWTVAPLNALFFACSTNNDIDGEVIVFNPWKYWNKIVREKNQEEIHQIHIISRALLSGKWSFKRINTYIKDKYAYDNLLVEDITKPFAFVANYTNKRIIHQRGCFTIHGVEKSELDSVPEFIKYSNRIKIKATAKTEIIKELNRLYINDYSIYPDFDGMKTMIAKKGSLFNINEIKKVKHSAH